MTSLFLLRRALPRDTPPPPQKRSAPRRRRPSTARRCRRSSPLCTALCRGGRGQWSWLAVGKLREDPRRSSRCRGGCPGCKGRRRRRRSSPRTLRRLPSSRDSRGRDTRRPLFRQGRSRLLAVHWRMRRRQTPNTSPSASTRARPHMPTTSSWKAWAAARPRPHDGARSAQRCSLTSHGASPPRKQA